MSMNPLVDHSRIAALRSNPEPVGIPAILQHAEKRKPDEPLKVRAVTLGGIDYPVTCVTEHFLIEPHIRDHDADPTAVHSAKVGSHGRDTTPDDPAHPDRADDQGERISRIREQVYLFRAAVKCQQLDANPGAWPGAFIRIPLFQACATHPRSLSSRMSA